MFPRKDKEATIIADICTTLSANEPEAALAFLESYPFKAVQIKKRRVGVVTATRVFVRDGFVDRYSGQKLIFPPVLRILSELLGPSFPFHPNWKTDCTHPAFWELGATIDHIEPVTQGGSDGESNLVSTSTVWNYAKSNWSLKDLGWELQPVGNLHQWDGLIAWFMDYIAEHEDLLKVGNVRSWHNAVVNVSKKNDVLYRHLKLRCHHAQAGGHGLTSPSG